MTTETQTNITLYQIALQSTMKQGYPLHTAYLKQYNTVRSKEGREELMMAYNALNK